LSNTQSFTSPLPIFPSLLNQDTVKDALFFCARALQEQHQEILTLKQQQRESQVRTK